MKQITSSVLGFAATAGLLASSPPVGPRKGLPVGTPDALSRGADRWAVDLLQRGGPEKFADASFTARISLFIEDV
jgi:hypothetical protein